MLAIIAFFQKTREFALQVEADAIIPGTTAESWENDGILYCRCVNCEENRRLFVQPFVTGQPQPYSLEYSKK
jgi:hypothetical protein